MKRVPGRIAMAGVLAFCMAVASGACAASESDARAESLGAEALRAEALRAEVLRAEALVSALRLGGAEVLSLGARGGLDGYFVTPPGGGGYALYVTGDGHAVAGLLYSPDGMEITGGQLAAAHGGEARTDTERTPPAKTLAPQTLVPQTLAPDTLRVKPPGPETASAAIVSAHAAGESSGLPFAPGFRTGLFERSASAFGFTLGGRGPLAVLLGDATCPWSRSAAARLGRAALEGRLRLRVVPVAVLGADSAWRAAGIAASPDPARAWFEGGGTADRAGAERIGRNNALFDEWGARAVPLIAWRTGDGAVRHRVGDIDDAGAWLRETFGPDTLGWERGLE